MATLDALIEIIKTFEPKAQPNYNQGYVGTLIDGKANNFTIFSPKKGFCRLSFRLPQTPDVDKEIDDSGLERDEWYS
jgi:hypothetical protein